MKFIYSRLFYVALSVLLSIGLSAQEYEIGVYVGGCNYQGDLADEVIQLNETHLGFGAILRVNQSAQWSLNTHIYVGRISGNDSNSGLSERRARGYSFSAPLTEIGLGVEWSPFKSPYRRYGRFEPSLNPYIFSGLGLALCSPNPQAPASTFPYPFPEAGVKDYFLNIPIGLGLKYKFTEQLCANAEIGYRYVFSDYLDGVSVHGNPNSPDVYIFAGFSMNYIFGDSRR